MNYTISVRCQRNVSRTYLQNLSDQPEQSNRSRIKQQFQEFNERASIKHSTTVNKQESSTEHDANQDTPSTHKHP